MRKKDKWYLNAFAFSHAKPLWSPQNLCVACKVLWMPENFMFAWERFVRGRETLHSLAIHLHPALPKNIVFAHITFAFSRETFSVCLQNFCASPKNFGSVCLQKFGIPSRNLWVNAKFRGECKTFANKQKVSWKSAKLLRMYAKFLKGMQHCCKQTQRLTLTNTPFLLGCKGIEI